MSTKTFNQKAIAVLLAAVLAFSVVLCVFRGVIVRAEENATMTEATFNYDKFYANLFVDSGTNPTQNGLPYFKDAVSNHHSKNPLKTFVDEVENDKVTKNAMIAWETLNAMSDFSVDLGYKYEVKWQDYYAAIFMELLNQNFNSKKVLKVLEEEDLQTGKTLAKQFVETSQLSKSSVEVEFWKEKIDGALSQPERDAMVEACNKQIKAWAGTEEKILNGFKIADTIIDVSSSYVEMIDNMSKFAMLSKMSNELFDVLKAMRSVCVDDTLNSVLDKMIDCQSSAENAVLLCFVDNIESVLVDVFAKEIDVVFDELIDALGSDVGILYKAFQVGVKSGKALCDICFGTSETNEQYYKLKIITRVDDVLQVATQKLADQYSKNKTLDNAKALTKANEMYFALLDTESEYMKTFADKLYLQKLFPDTEGYQSLYNAVDGYQNSVAQYYDKMTGEMTLNAMAKDFPGIYDTITGVKEQDLVPVTGVESTPSSLVIGLEDGYDAPTFLIASVKPENASNKLCKYSSSDESILSVTPDIGSITPIKPGDVVVTITTVDGGFQTKVSIKVVEGKSEDYINPDSFSDKFPNGVEYSFRNGLLRIWGTGEIPYYSFDADWAGTIPRDKIKMVIVQNGITNIPWGCFSDMPNLSTVLIEGKLSIEARAFSGTPKLQTVEFGEGILSVGSEAFSNCQGVSRIPIVDGDIGSNAFFNCVNLLSVELGDGVSVGEGAFLDCRNLKKVVTKGSFSEVGHYAFKNCKGLTKVEIEPKSDMNDWVGCEAFKGCDNLKEVLIGDGVSAIGYSAFEDCINLEKIVLPSSLIDIQWSVFKNCKALKTVSLPNTIPYISRDLFNGCVALESITLPKDVEEIGDRAFLSCSSLKGDIKLEKVKEIGESAFLGCGSIQSITLGQPNVNVGAFAFCECESIDSVSLPKVLGNIGEKAFADCKGVFSNDLSIEGSVLGKYAFANCQGIENLTIDGDVELIEGGTFDNNKTLKNIVIGDSVKSIQPYAFFECENIESVYLGNGMTEFFVDIFPRNPKIKRIHFGLNMNDISLITVNRFTELEEIQVVSGNKTYSSIDGVLFTADRKKLLLCPEKREDNYVIPEGTETIGELAFWESKLTSVSFPDSLQTVEDSAFWNGKTLTTIEQKQTDIKTVGDNAFCGCESLEYFAVSPYANHIGEGAFDGCNNLKKFDWPETVKIIGNRTFSECYELKQPILTKAISSIGKGSFSDCYSLGDIIIPESVTFIGEGAFSLENYDDSEYRTNGRRIYFERLNACDLDQDASHIETTFKGNELHVKRNAKGYDENGWENFYVIYGYDTPVSLSTSSQNAMVGDEIELTARVDNPEEGLLYSFYSYKVNDSGLPSHGVIIENTLNNVVTWIPDEQGEYTIDVAVTFENGVVINTSSRITVVSNPNNGEKMDGDEGYVDEPSEAPEDQGEPAPADSPSAPEEPTASDVSPNPHESSEPDGAPEPEDPSTPDKPVTPDEPAKPDEPSNPDDTKPTPAPAVKSGVVKGDDGKWALYKDDKVNTSYTGIAKNEYGWWRIVEGYVDFNATGIYKNEFGWWRVEDGKVDFEADGIYRNEYGWWKTTDGKVTFDETGVFKNEFGWWRVEDSKVDFSADGIYKNEYGWWKTTDGKVTFVEDGVFKNEYGWWKVDDSKVDFKFTGIAKNKYGTWYVKNGKVDFNKNGKVKFEGKTYTVKNGKVQ